MINQRALLIGHLNLARAGYELYLDHAQPTVAVLEDADGIICKIRIVTATPTEKTPVVTLNGNRIKTQFYGLDYILCVLVEPETCWLIPTDVLAGVGNAFRLGDKWDTYRVRALSLRANTEMQAIKDAVREKYKVISPEVEHADDILSLLGD